MVNVTDLFECHKDEVYRFLRYQLQSHEDACDGVQEVFFRAWKSIERYRGDANAKTWLLSIARHYAIDVIRKKKRDSARARNLSENPAASYTPPTYVLELEETLASLRPSQRQVFVLRCIEDLSIKDVAQILGWSSARVQVTYFRALRVLRRLYSEEVGREGVDVS